MYSTRQFFTDLFGEQHFNVRCLGKNRRIMDLNGLYNENLISKMNQLNQQGYEIYYVPNSGGYKDAEIVNFNTVFVDFDCGRDENGEYYPLHKVDEYKQLKLHELNAFTFEPSAVIETRNGFHVYWFLTPEATIEQFKECEQRLIAYLDADSIVKSPANLLRVPDTYWCKNPINRFLCKIVNRNDVRYDIKDIIDILPEVNKDLGKTTYRGLGTINKKENIDLLLIDGHKTSNSTNLNKSYINERNASALKESLNASPIVVCNHDEVYEYLKKQDLREFLGVKGTSFNCIFHHDKNPSATIFTNEDSAHQIYHCHSSNCGVSGTIIQVAGMMTNLDRYKTLAFLRDVYQIQYKQTDWQVEQKERLEENKRFLLSDEVNDFYPALYDRIRNYFPQLITLTEYASSKIVTENFTVNDGNPIFYASNRYLAQIFGKDVKTAGERMSLFTYLGLIRRVPDDEVPEFLLTRAKHEAAIKKQRYTINFYSIPTYSEDLLKFSVQRAMEFKEKGFTMKGFCRELLLRSLGMEEANRVFPKEKDKEVSESCYERAARIESIALSLMMDKGWTTEREILLMLQSGGERLSDKFIKRILPELLDKYGLVKKQLNKQLKQDLDVHLNAYPKIITWDTEKSASVTIKKESRTKSVCPKENKSENNNNALKNRYQEESFIHTTENRKGIA